MSYNLKVTVQKGGVSAWTTGLIVLERIMGMAKGGIGRSHHSERLETILKNRCVNSSWHESESLPTEYPTLVTGTTEKENISLGLGEKSLTGSSGDLVIQEVLSAKFELIVLNTVSSCLLEEELYGEGLRVLKEYSQLSDNPFKGEEKVTEMLRTLLDNIRAGYERLSSLESYYHLLTKLKDKSVLSLAPTLKELAKLWIQLQEKAGSTRSIPQAHQQEQEVTMIELILGKFLVSALDAMQYKTAISLILEVND